MSACMSQKFWSWKCNFINKLLWKSTLIFWYGKFVDYSNIPNRLLFLRLGILMIMRQSDRYLHMHFVLFFNTILYFSSLEGTGYLVCAVFRAVFLIRRICQSMPTFNRYRGLTICSSTRRHLLVAFVSFAYSPRTRAISRTVCELWKRPYTESTRKSDGNRQTKTENN